MARAFREAEARNARATMNANAFTGAGKAHSFLLVETNTNAAIRMPTKHKKPRFTRMMMGRTAHLYGKGNTTPQVVDYLFQRYAAKWGISDRSEFEQYLLKKRPGSRPHISTLFEGKDASQSKETFHQWWQKQKREREQSGIRVKKLNEDPQFTAKQRKAAAEGLRRLRQDPGFRERERERGRKHASELNESIRNDSKRAERRRETARKTIKQINKDPAIVQRRIREANKSLAEREKDPQFVEARRKWGRKGAEKVWGMPGFREKMAEMKRIEMIKRNENPNVRSASGKRLRKYNQRPEIKKRNIERLIEINKSPERRLANSERLKKQLKDPEFVEKMIQGIMERKIAREESNGKRENFRIAREHRHRQKELETHYNPVTEKQETVETKTPQEEIIREERRRAVSNAISQLKPIEQEIIVRFIFQNESNGTIAHALKMSRKKVEEIKETALQKMANQLRGHA